MNGGNQTRSNNPDNGDDGDDDDDDDDKKDKKNIPEDHSNGNNKDPKKK